MFFDHDCTAVFVQQIITDKSYVHGSYYYRIATMKNTIC